MRSPILSGKTIYSMIHVPVRQALDEAYTGVGPRPPYDERVYAAAITAGASDEWRIMIEQDGKSRIRSVFPTEAEADAVMDSIKVSVDARSQA